MKSLFQNTTTTSVLAVMLTFLSMGGLAFIIYQYGGDPTTRTQIITGLLVMLGYPASYYFGSAKSRGTSGDTLNQADSITTITTPTPET